MHNAKHHVYLVVLVINSVLSRENVWGDGDIGTKQQKELNGEQPATLPSVI